MSGGIQGRKSESNLRRPSADVLRSSNLRYSESATKSEHLAPPGGSLMPRRTFSLLRLRNLSDPSLGHKARKYDHKSSPLLQPPAIIRTPPTTFEHTSTAQEQNTAIKQRTGNNGPTMATPDAPSSRGSFSRLRDFSKSARLSRVTFDDPGRGHMESSLNVPPPYEDHQNNLAIPPPRLSESSRSTASSGDHIAVTTTTTHTVQTTTTFWKIPRRKKTPTPLFPLPPKVEKVVTQTTHGHLDPDHTPRAGYSAASSTRGGSSKSNSFDCTPNASSALVASSLGFAVPGTPLLRSDSTASTHSFHSNPASLGTRSSRGRSLTLGCDTPTSVAGRNSMSGFFGLRLRRESEPGTPMNFTRNSSPHPYGNSTLPSSVVASRERLIIPERHVEDTPKMYLSKLEKAVSKSVVASLLARSDDSFHVSVLRTYMSTFDFEDDPMDMALRKLLMEAELPRETQQIDRVIQAFANRYHECNPLIYTSPEQAYFIAFSLLILHTDVFNKNNRYKMQKPDYVKNTQGEGVTTDILECFYSNITYTPFIHVEDDLDINGEKIVPQKPKRSMFSRGASEAKRGVSIKEPVDPYALIMEHRLDLLRPSLRDVIEIEDPYSYLGTATTLDIPALHKSFFRYAVLQVVSARSRPDAFLSPSTVANPQDADPGVVEIKVTKVGILWRKDTKKKKMRDPWQEWGAMLTGSQLYFFRNVGWVRGLMQQYEQHQKADNAGTPVVFTPALSNFKSDALVSTDDAVALLDNGYRKHKHAFAFIRHGGLQEYFLAESESEMNDWLAKLNYAATFKTAGVRMRGVVGGNYEGQRMRVIRRLGDPPGARVVDSPSGEVSILKGGIDHQLATDISNARRQIVEQKIHDSEQRLVNANKQLEAYLRNARHLSILTPIQAKTREQVVLAAGALAAKLQWVRMDIWKLKCHRDILILDMDEEKRTMRDHARRSAAYGTTRRPSKTSVHSSKPLDSPHEAPETPGSVTPTQTNFRVSINFDPIPTLELSEPPEENLDPSHSCAASVSSGVRRPSSASSSIPQIYDGPSRGTDVQSIETATSKTVSEEDLSLDPEKAGERDKAKGKELGARQSIRRGLHKTLREAHASGHKRKKSKDIAGEGGIAIPEKKADDEGLPRGSPNFTLHGKKASVITFGSEWNTMSPEERLRRHKNSPMQDAGSENRSPIVRAEVGLFGIPPQNDCGPTKRVADRPLEDATSPTNSATK